MTTQALTTVTQTQVMELTIQDVKAYFCPIATDAEAYIFLRLCQAQGLNPYLREAYLIKYEQGKPASIVVGKETFTKRADVHPNYTGYKAGIIVANAQGVITEREGTFYLKAETLEGGWAEVYRNDRQYPIRATVNLGEYNTNMSNWKSKPATMIRKVALVQALREAFPAAFAGLYDASEMGIGEDAIEGDIVRREEAPGTPSHRPAARAVNVTPEQAPPPPDDGQEAMLRELADDNLTALMERHGVNRGNVDAALAASGRGATWDALNSTRRQAALGWLDKRFATAQTEADEPAPQHA